jgi:hypothetical protein
MRTGFLIFRLIVVCGFCLSQLERSAIADLNEVQPPAQQKQAFELMKQLCNGVIHNSVCIGKDGITILGPDGKLHAPQPGWQPTTGGPMVFIPDVQHHLSPVSALSKPVDWSNFVSQSGFRIIYPNQWFKIDATPRNLNIISSKERVEAVMIPKGAQMISVYEKSPNANDDYLSTFKAENPEDKILDHKQIATSDDVSGGCSKIYMVKSADEIGPNTFFLEIHMYCKIRGRLFILKLTQWESDNFNQDAYDIAIEMLKTLRLMQ